MGELVLYRKYRPRGFDEIVGQESVVRALSNAISQGKLAHAYLFSGPRGVGKTTIARLIAKAANCANAATKGVVPCNKCESCVRYNDGVALDLNEIDAASSRGIDEIRDEVHMLTKEAWNALLKIIEEPPSHVMLVLATTEIEKVPATIISRTQHFEFRRPAISAIAARLVRIAKAEGAMLQENAARVVAMAAEGSLRDAESILGQIMAVEDEKITETEVEDALGLPRREAVREFFKALAEKDAVSALSVIEKAMEGGHDAGQFLKASIRFARNAALTKLDAKLGEAVTDELLPEEKGELEKILSVADAAHINRILSVLTETSETLRRSPIPELPLELAALEITKL
ncbi:MAG: polymerase III, subunit gamma and tau protein [Parcubacteria group bacterium GW2011_GWA1_51_12]|nr:MAG: polymerase III, subunit gamma and tau protein [Parcubacteria group bacterium GW2011_GWA1_51_12]